MTAAAITNGRGTLARLGSGVLEILQILGEAVILFLRTTASVRHVVRHREKVVAQLIQIGNDCLPISALVSLFTGMVLVVQAADQLRNYTQEILGSLVGLAMTKELGPVVVAFLVAGRSGSAIAAEIGSMKVYEEISALKTMDIDPVPYLSMPRFIAMTIALPMLILYADVIGIIGGAFVVAADPAVNITVRQYFDNLTEWVNMTDIFVGLVKGIAFGMIISVVACAFGFRTSGGSEGVARSTTSAVVWGFVMIIISDYFIVRLAFVILNSGGGVG